MNGSRKEVLADALKAEIGAASVDLKTLFTDDVAGWSPYVTLSGLAALADLAALSALGREDEDERGERNRFERDHQADENEVEDDHVRPDLPTPRSLLDLILLFLAEPGLELSVPRQHRHPRCPARRRGRGCDWRKLRDIRSAQAGGLGGPPHRGGWSPACGNCS